MNKGPKPGTNRQQVSVANMHNAWGDGAPDWIVLLAHECDRFGQRVVADRIGLSPSIVSGVLRARYGMNGRGGDLKAVEQAVRGVLMDAMVDCLIPGIGTLPSHKCIQFQRQKPTSASPLNIRAYPHLSHVSQQSERRSVMLSDNLKSLHDRLDEYRDCGMEMCPEAVAGICAILKAAVDGARALESSVVAETAGFADREARNPSAVVLNGGDDTVIVLARHRHRPAPTSRPGPGGNTGGDAA